MPGDGLDVHPLIAPGVTTELSLGSHALRVFAAVDVAPDNPDLDIVVEAVQDSTVSG